MNLSSGPLAQQVGRDDRWAWITRRRDQHDIDYSPDGRHVAYALVDAVSDPTGATRGELHVISLDTQREDAHHNPTSVVVGNSTGARLPRWSPCANHLAYVDTTLTTATTTAAVVIVDIDHTTPNPVGSGPRIVARFDGEVDSLAWSPSGSSLLVVLAEPGCYSHLGAGNLVAGAAGDGDPIVRRRNDAWRTADVIDIDGADTDEAAVRRVDPQGWSVLESAWLDDDTIVALAATDPSGSGWYHSTIVLLPIDGMQPPDTIHAAQRWYLEGLDVDPISRRAAVVEGYCSDAGLLCGSVVIVDLDTATTSRPWPTLDNVATVEFLDDGALGWSGWVGSGTAAGIARANGTWSTTWSGAEFVGDTIDKPHVHWRADGEAFVASRQDFHHPPELALGGNANSMRTITAHNAGLVDGLALPTVKSTTWTAPDGLAIEGTVLIPHGLGPHPGVVLVHGGPTWVWGSFFVETCPNPLALAMAGYAVLLPNQRGSYGRGAAFAEAVIGDAGGADFDDVVAGVTHAIDQGWFDPTRVGIAGLSYGGFFAAWAPTRTTVFGAAVAISVVADWPSIVLASDAHDQSLVLLGDDVFGPDSLHRQRSPAFHPQLQPTPTLVVAGALDRCTPIGQAEELYNKLVREGVETELVIYPREGHVMCEAAHVVDLTERTIAWFDRHLPR